MRKLIVFIAIIIVGIIFFFIADNFRESPETIVSGLSTTQESGSKSEQTTLKHIDFSRFDPAFRFSANIPASWEAEYLPAQRALNIYNPHHPAETKRDQSQIWITHFSADRFLTLGTVAITRNEKTSVRGHEAVIYEITKKPETPNFTGQPLWRNSTHTAYDVRLTNTAPSLFYPFAMKPDLPEGVTRAFTDSLVFHNDKESFVGPLSRLADRPVKKPFGVYVTPQTSPVTPEFFTGYHTAVDYEIFPHEEEKEVSVLAFCGGKLREARSATGYGGVAVQECLLMDEAVTVVYGHLRTSSIVPKIGDYLVPGDQIGVLGDAGEEAGGGRKHLHFGIYKGTASDIRGYVQSQSELSNWLDPAAYVPVNRSR